MVGPSVRTAFADGMPWPNRSTAQHSAPYDGGKSLATWFFSSYSVAGGGRRKT